MMCSFFLLFILYSIYPFLAGKYIRVTEEYRYETSSAARASRSLSNLRNIIFDYAAASDNLLPSPDNWFDLLMMYSEDLSEFESLIFHAEHSFNVAFNKNLGGLKLSEVTGNTVLLFTANGDRNLNGDYDLMKTYQREQEQYAYLCLVNGRIVRYRLSDGTLFEIRPPSNEAFRIESEDDKDAITWEP